MSLTYEQRANEVGAWLKTKALARLERPPRLDDMAAVLELADMTNDIVSEIPAGIDAMRLAEILNAAHTELRKSHESTRWPTIAVIVKAIRKASIAKGTGAVTGESPAEVVDMVVDWWVKFKRPMPSTARIEHAAEVVRRGHATWGELRRAGFPIPYDRVAEAKAESDPKHQAILDELRGVNERLAAAGIKNQTRHSRRAAEDFA